METPTAEAKAPSSFMDVFTTPEASQEWEQAIEATTAAKRGVKPTAKPDVDPEIAEEEAAIAELEKPEVPAEEVKQDKPTEEMPQFKSKKAADHFKSLKESSEKKINELRAELESAKKLGADKSELEAIRAELAQERQAKMEMEERLKLVAVKEHPGFKKHFDAKIDSAITTAKRIVGAEKASQIEQLLRLPDSDYRTEKLNDIAEAMGGVKAAQLGAVLLEFDKINGEREAEISKYKERYQEMTQAQQKQYEERARQMESLFGDRLKSLTDPEKGIEFWRKKEGDDEWNNAVEARVAMAKSVFSGELEPKDMANVAFWAAAAPDLMKDNKGLMQRVAELEKQLNAAKANKPKIGEDAGGSKDGDDDDGPITSFTGPEALARIAQRMGR